MVDIVSSFLILLYFIFCVFVLSWYCHLHGQGWSMWSRLHHLESLSVALGRWSQPGRWDNFVSMINEDESLLQINEDESLLQIDEDEL